MDNLDSSVKRLKKQLENPHGIHDGKLMTALSWAEKYTQDKRARPAESRQAIAWLKEKRLWQAYLNEYVRDKPKASWGGKRAGAGYKNQPKGERTVIVSCRIPLSLKSDNEIGGDWLKDAIARKLEGLKHG